MALVAGSVTVDGTTGARTGSGLALALYDADVDPYDPNTPQGGWPAAQWKAALIEGRQRLATGSNAKAAAIVACVGAADVRVPAGALDTGVPSVERVIGGAVE